MLRPRVLAGLISAALPVVAGAAMAEPLDKESCANLQVERSKLLTRDMQAALDQGPDWVKTHLKNEDIERVRRFLTKSTAATPEYASPVPLPDRKPASPAAEGGEGKPSQALADSDKTPPGKLKATR